MPKGGRSAGGKSVAGQERGRAGTGIIAAMHPEATSVAHWLLGPEPVGKLGHLWPRWLFLRALGLIYFSAFYSLIRQIRGLIGPNGILPAAEYLQAVGHYVAGIERYWYAPTLLWFGAGNRALEAICWAGIVASLLLVFNIWPRLMLGVCLVTFLSFVSAAQDFSGYQSDGMLLAAGFLGLFFAPPGLRPGLGRSRPPSRASLFLLQWLWFLIYFESGVAKIQGGDPQWRSLTAMDEYYQNGPLPTWIGWYVQHLPHWFHAATVVLTLAVELGLIWMLFLPRRFRIICFLIVTPFEIGIILTANYTFLNFLVLSLGILLLDDRFLAALVPARWKPGKHEGVETAGLREPTGDSWRARWNQMAARIGMAIAGICLGWIFYATTVLLLEMIWPGLPLPRSPVVALEPFRIANRYGLFGVMTRNRYEIEFQGSDDGQKWVPYPCRYKPQDPHQPPGIYAPYQPRLDWNLWFASLGTWREYPIALRTEQRLLENDADVLALFAGNPFPEKPPREVRAVLWQYWFTDLRTKRTQGLWWRRELLGLYAPALEREPNGRFGILELPGGLRQFP
jgi:hypothetical protein